MPRLLTAVDEAVADHEPSEPFGWFRSHGDVHARSLKGDRCLLFLGIDAEKKHVNTVDRMLDWFKDFKAKLVKIDPKQFSATVFVLDWPKGIEGHSPALPDYRDVDRLMGAGLYYRPKDPAFYGAAKKTLAASLVADLLANQLMPEKLDQDLADAVAPRPAPDESNCVYHETAEFLGSKQLIWPEDTIRRLLGR
jgi:hypothetical protein